MGRTREVKVGAVLEFDDHRAISRGENSLIGINFVAYL